MIVFSLLIIAIIYSLAAYVSYVEGWRNTGWFWVINIIIGLISSIIWCWMVGYIDSKDNLYVYNLFWDTIICSIFYIFPILFFGVKMDGWGIAGLSCIIVGLVIIKCREQ